LANIHGFSVNKNYFLIFRRNTKTAGAAVDYIGGIISLFFMVTQAQHYISRDTSESDIWTLLESLYR